MIDEKDFFHQPVKRNIRTYDNILKKLQQVKEMITQLVVCKVLNISKNIKK